MFSKFEQKSYLVCQKKFQSFDELFSGGFQSCISRVRVKFFSKQKAFGKNSSFYKSFLILSETF